MTSEANTVSADKVVSIHYTLTSQEGEVLDRSGSDPLDYLHGHQNIVPGLERQIAGKTEGDKFSAVVEAAEGYGERMPDAQKTIPREAFPADAPLREGVQLTAQAPDGQLIGLWILKVSDEEVLVDLNHPLAGQTLTFEVEVVSIRDSTDEERAHGHAHPGDGHGHG
jgi:FKBP-type peptidyl-prolyl cis-trans isomerase SlyD